MSVLLNPNKQFDRFLELRDEKTYSSRVKNELKLLTADEKEGTDIYGSYKMRLQKYPADIDTFEYFIRCCDSDATVTKFEKALKKILKRIDNKKLHYFSDFKAGFDERYPNDIGTIHNGNFVPYANLGKITKELYEKNLIDEEDRDVILYILNKQKENIILNSDDYDVIKNIFRIYSSIKWSIDEIMKGKKRLRNNKLMTLKYALSQKSIIKLDEITFINGSIYEITDVFLLGYIEEGEDDIVKLNQKNPVNINELPPITEILKEDTEKFFYSDMWYNPFKAIKRIFANLRLPGIVKKPEARELLKLLFPIISSNTSLLYQAKAQLETIELLIEKKRNFPFSSVHLQIEIMKDKLITDIDLKRDEINYVIGKLNKILETKDKNIITKNIDIVANFLSRKINYDSIWYLNEVGLNPLPNFVLPVVKKYDTSIKRYPQIDPVNPLVEYEEFYQSKSGSGCDNCSLI